MLETTKDSSAKQSLARWTILSVTTLGAFMAALDSNIVPIALPAISRGLSTGISLLGWVITGYILALAALVLQSGKLGDRYGKKSVYLVGFAIFAITSALCGASQTAYQLIAFRIVQGIGASILAATAFPLIFASFPPSERGSAVGVNSVAWAVGAIAGPILGGALASIDWRLIFYVNVPVAAVAILLGARRIPGRLNERNAQTARMNVLNSVLLGLTIAMVMLWLTFFDLRLVPVAVVALVAFVLVEVKSSNPILNRELIKNHGFVYSVVSLGVLVTSFFGIVFIMSFYFQSVLGLSSLSAGAWIAPLPISLAVCLPVAGRLFDRLRRPALTSIVAAIVLAGALVLLSSAILAQTPGLYLAPLLVAVGAGGGFVWAPEVSSALKFSRQELRGVANGTAFTLIYIGFAASIAIAVSVSARSLPSSLVARIYLGTLTGLTTSQAALFDQGLSTALLALAAVGVIGIPLLILLLREQTRHF
jgi:EmrB/QacA subfamily drug resistance transporter